MAQDATPVLAAADPEATLQVRLSSAGIALAGETGKLYIATASTSLTFTGAEPQMVTPQQWQQVLRNHRVLDGDALVELVPAPDTPTVAAAQPAGTANTTTEAQQSHGV